jgi:glutamine amidotransferase
MHNGGIEQFSKIKRRLQQQLPDEIFNVVNGNTDSEWSFALFLSKVCHVRTFLPHIGTLIGGPKKLRNPNAQSFTHTELQNAMLETIASINQFGEEAGVDEVCFDKACKALLRTTQSLHSPV